MNTVLHALRKLDLFSVVDAAALSRLAQHGELRILEPGDIVARAGSPQTAVVCVTEGRLALYRRNPKRKVALLLGVVSAPGVIISLARSRTPSDHMERP